MIYNPGGQLGKSVRGGAPRKATGRTFFREGRNERKIDYRQSATREREARSDRDARRKRKAGHPAESKAITQQAAAPAISHGMGWACY
jgi:hypothetical protein